MDGNGRWAAKRGLSRSAGHLEGSKTSKKVIEYGFNKGIKIISIFAFSTENFNRSKEEVDYLMNLFVLMFKSNFDIFIKNGIKIVFSGKREKLPSKVIKSMESLESRTIDNSRGILNICLNYGGQDEIVDVVKNISSKVKSNEIDIESIDKELVNKYLYNDLAPIDLLIRTSGEYRISNFMLWQIAYSELYFTDTLFPDFNELELDKALEEYSKRNRRFGS